MWKKLHTQTQAESYMTKHAPGFFEDSAQFTSERAFSLHLHANSEQSSRCRLAMLAQQVEFGQHVGKVIESLARSFAQTPKTWAFSNEFRRQQHEPLICQCFRNTRNSSPTRAPIFLFNCQRKFGKERCRDSRGTTAISAFSVV